MRILVCISCVPDTTSKISFIDSKKFDSNGIQYIIGPYEDYGLARAVELKEKDKSIDISVLNVGLKDNDPLLRKALAIGADRAYRINSEAKDSLSVAKHISNFLIKNSFDLILMGKESIDYNSGLVHHMVGSILKINSFSPIAYLELDNNHVIIKKETDDGIEKIKAKMPLILGCQEPIAEWKIPNMRGIMNARTKEFKVLEPESFDSKISFENYNIPEKRGDVKLFEMDNINELISKLNLNNL